ncbi:chromosomal replication initiation protein [Rubripirellula obstinata]|uniref:Chromosomal replication initiation protein n=1 Tax=Rubripirellula obstinata TaxID=406547 RepID=A0A5B1CI27_9BACT|nr:transposase [Rubripirellula obstinata]KAA1259143.1 chromosomal replication initiation protein [Rubripirellula obstinata]
MPRFPRLQYENAIYHIVARGDGRRKLFHDQGHYDRFTKGLVDEVDRSGWVVVAFCWMPNHIHALIKTPQPNLCRGMQHWLSGYANWYAKRNRRTGHLFQGRYKAFPVEDEGYYWNLSRYIHLNPCNGGKPLAESPEEYRNSSYRGYARKSCQVDWIAYDDHHRYWSGLNGGKDPSTAYRKYVKEGLLNPPDPSVDRLKNWVYGGEDFLKRMLHLASSEEDSKHSRRVRRSSVVTPDAVLNATAQEYGVSPEEYCGFRSGAGGRDVAAYLCRRYTSATLAELSVRFGLGHPDSSSDMVKRAKKLIESNSAIKNRVKRIEKRLSLKPETRV